MSAAVIEVQGLSKHFRKDDEELIALRGVDLTVEQGSFLVLLGRSGCGKSTLLNLLAGLTPPTSGQITYDGKPMRGPNTQVGYLTQHDTLMPWRDVARNVQMPRELRGESKKERAAVAAELIKLVGLDGFERHYPRELSGGMRRRASLARMLCADPETLLLDEPFGALDAQLRTELQGELLRLWSGSGRTVVFVTHDIEEALILADRVVVLGPVGTILLDQPVDLPRPRDPDDIRVDPHFVELHRRLSAALKEGAR
ncbi:MULTISPECIES: ABC transporter ATP-binding protein [Micromonospora]|uniref:ABC transporter ATP-binding protein n=1 Tax=Micromonospora musae TaxID=1894970 RepID=A0A3A9XM49_9ACTN|nr:MULTISPECIES: ABC transporter ATP-binding protein [Micromonospora]RKN16615.1 ABC transporter ATP-binding protein [Micromonospora musae]RKN26181.1 ABC transporter ATP-binding protein [Micromonospora musae]TYB96905.1 ABC transporter ATP-binding protein [Micromonospora sp. WP24]